MYGWFRPQAIVSLLLTCRAGDLGTPRSCPKLLDDPDILSNRKPEKIIDSKYQQMLQYAQYDASSYLEQFPKNQMWQWELREGGIPGLVTGGEGGRPHVQRQDQVLLHVLQDQVVAHNLDVGDDLVDQALDVTRRSTLEIETGYDRNISWIILEEFLQNLLLLLLLGLPPLLPCRLAACNAACILTACHRAEKVVTNKFPPCSSYIR